MKPNERLQALRILSLLLNEHASLNHSLPSIATISPFTKELCFGVCRHYFRLEVIADSLMKKRPKSTEVWVCLLMGIYQLHYLNVADYAVVKETVALLPQVKALWAKGLVNAILREYCREKENLMAALNNNYTYKHGHPQWFVSRLRKDWPEYWQAICQANDERPPMSLRINAQLTTRERYLQSLSTSDIEATPLTFSEQGIRLKHPCDVHELPGFADGLVSVQDEAAQLAISMLNLSPGLRILDACCAPGGKTCHILETQPDLLECVALDIDSERLKRVNENLARLKLHATVIAGDALHPSQWWDGKPFDRILLDAPCSATGVIRRHPDIKLLRTQNDINTITAVQHDILNAIWPLLAPGGILVYATCSIMPVENEQQIANFCKTHSDCEYQPQICSWGHPLLHGRQILPGEHHMDGFFYSVLKKII